jgi:hypothetical protein
MGVLIGLVIAGFIGRWVFMDATKRGKTRGQAILWGVTTWMLMILVLPLWFLTRPPLPGKEQPFATDRIPQLCASCGKYYDRNPSFCPNCGAQVAKIA